MKIAICDDCMEDALSLKNLLHGQDSRIYVDTDSLLADVEDKNISYDLHFPDIYIGDSVEGIELAKKLRAIDADAVLCFVSNRDAFYCEAYDVYAIQYLLKPVEGRDYSMELNLTDHGWFPGEDGFYYYSRPVEDGQDTEVLIKSCTQTAESPEDGYCLQVKIVSQTLQTVGFTDREDIPAVHDA